LLSKGRKQACMLQYNRKIFNFLVILNSTINLTCQKFQELVINVSVSLCLQVMKFHSRVKLSSCERDLGLFVVEHRGDKLSVKPLRSVGRPDSL
jgi:hypothetical protein